MKLSKILWFVSGKQIIIDLWNTDKSWYFAIVEFNNYFIIWWPSWFLDHYLQAVICRSPCGLSSNEKEENFAKNYFLGS